MNLELTSTNESLLSPIYIDGEKDGFDWATLKDLLREKTSLTNDDFGGVDVKALAKRLQNVPYII